MEWGCGQVKLTGGDEKKEGKDFLVVQLAKASALPVQGPGVRSLVGENQDSTCRVVWPKKKKKWGVEWGKGLRKSPASLDPNWNQSG